LQRLRGEFCPPIDEPAFYAICSDHNLRSQDELNICYRDLAIIKAAAIEADTTNFDASGTGGFAARETETSGESESSHNGANSWSQDVDSITTGLSELAWDDPSANGQCLDDADNDTKASWLRAMFPNIVEEKICYRLEKCNSNLTRTIDELLNLWFIDQNEPGGLSAVLKGIDGFAQAEDHSRGRKGKAKGKRRMPTNESTRSSSMTSIDADASVKPRNVWTSMSDDVDFICARTHLATQNVRILYETQHKSLSRTINSMALKEGEELTSMEALDSLEQRQLAELRGGFPTIPDSSLYGLLILSGNTLPAASDLAAAMVASPTATSPAEQLQIIPKYAPVDLGSDTNSSMSPLPSPWSQLNHSTAKSLAVAKAAAGSTALAQSINAYKRGKSDHLMGGAAAYYAAVGSEHFRAAKELSAHAAEGHVMSQSTTNMLDLHGVSVADAVRIAKEQVALWWESLGDAKHASSGGGPAREGYRVVTGIGRHSRGGAPKIGPAVSRMLIRDGWKVIVGQGEILVTGRARRA
jgi:hypothetical protein